MADGPDHVPEPAPPSLARRFADLKVRIASAAVLAGAGAVAIWLGGVVFAAWVALLAGAIGWEWRSVTHHGGGRCGPDAAYLILAIAGAALLAHFMGPGAAFWWLGGVLALGLAWDMITGQKTAAFWALVGGSYCGAAAIALVWLRQFEPYGMTSVIWIILVVAAADVGGYFTGKIMRGPKFWPRVSPKKTWSGMVGGLALAFFLGGLFSWATSGTYFVEVCFVSALAAMVSQAGDLAESALKRRFDVKDASNLIPGHGGALDRFDGLIAATLVVAVLTNLRDQTVFVW